MRVCVVFAVGFIGLFSVAYAGLVSEAHKKSVVGLGCTGDGSAVITGSWDKTAKIWDKSGSLKHTLEGHTDWLRDATISPNGKWAATAGDDAEIIIWDAATGTATQHLKGHTRGVYCVAFSPDSSKLVSGGDDWLVKQWNVQDGSLINTMQGHEDLVNRVGYSPDGKFVISASADRHVHLWDSTTGKVDRIFYGHMQQVLGFSFSPDGQTLATSGADAVKIWNVATAKLTKSFGDWKHGWYRDIRFVNAGTVVVSSDDKNIRTFSLDGRITNELGTSSGWILRICLTNDGTLYAVGDDLGLNKWPGVK